MIIKSSASSSTVLAAAVSVCLLGVDVSTTAKVDRVALSVGCADDVFFGGAVGAEAGGKMLLPRFMNISRVRCRGSGFTLLRGVPDFGFRAEDEGGAIVTALGCYPWPSEELSKQSGSAPGMVLGGYVGFEGVKVASKWPQCSMIGSI